jgi:hypothetical protein
MSSLKQLRKEAQQLIRKNLLKIDGKSIGKFTTIADTARSIEKLEDVINALKTLNTPKQSIQSVVIDNGLDNGLETKKIRAKNTISLKDVVFRKKEESKKEIIKKEKEIVFVNLDIRVNVSFYVIDVRKPKEDRPQIQQANVDVSIRVPKDKEHNIKYLIYVIKNSGQLEEDLKQYVRESPEKLDIANIRFISKVNKSEMFKSKMDLKSIPMRHATYVKLDIEGLKDYKYTPFQCVYGALKYKYNYDADKLLKIFQEYVDLHENLNNTTNKINLQLNDGVTTNMILYLAKLKDISVYALDVNKKIFAKHISKNRNNNALVYVLHNEHFYLMDDPKQILSIKNSNTDNKKQSELSSDLFRDHTIKNYLTMYPILENIPVSEYEQHSKVNIIYSMSDLYSILLQLYQQYNDQISTHNIKTDSNKRVIYFYYKKFDLHIYADINYDVEKQTSWKDVKALCEKVNIEFKNQSISSIVMECEKSFYKLKSERLTLSTEQKDELLEECNNQCIVCERQFKKKFYQFDHIIPLVCGGSNELDNIQVLCIECHHEKTRSEQENGDYIFVNQSESSFNQEVKNVFTSNDCKAYAFIENVENVKIPKTHNKLLREVETSTDAKASWKLLHIDICKTRRNILLYNKLPLAAFSVMDKVEDFNYQKDKIVAGIYYVVTSCYFPIRGNGWYSHNMIEHLLNTNRISKMDIKYKLVSTLTLQADYFTAFFNYIVDNFGSKYSKLGPNAMVGLFNKTGTTKTSLTMTSSYKQAIAHFYDCPDNFVVYDNDIDIYSIFENKNIEFDETRSPLYKYVVEQEAIEMDLLKTRIQRCGGIVTRYNTDCISAYFQDDRKIKEVVENTYWDDNKTVLKYKFENKEEDQLNKFNDRMKSFKRTDEYRHNFNRDWNVLEDDDDFDKLANDILSSNQSYLINGLAGCGKSTLLKRLMKKLEKGLYTALAPTNKACRIIKGQTIHRFLASAFNNKSSLERKLEGVEYIIVDEISMVKELFYKVFLSIKRIKPEIKFILCGNFDQLEPVRDRYQFDYENSPALFELCDGNKIELTKCRRTDDIMFKLSHPSTINDLDISQFGQQFTYRHLSYTNNKRIEVNKICMEKFIEKQIKLAKKNNKAKPQPLKLSKVEYDKNSQDVELLPNMPIIARVNNKGYDIANNETFTIYSIKDNIIKIESDEEHNIIDIPVKEFQKLFYVAFCITVHKSQGATFDHPYTIHQWSLFDKKLKYVALSRTTKKEYVNIIIN